MAMPAIGKIQVGDAVRTKRGDGIVQRISSTTKIRVGVQFVSNGPLSFFLVEHVTRMTLDQIRESTISGVGCNQAMEL